MSCSESIETPPAEVREDEVEEIDDDDDEEEDEVEDEEEEVEEEEDEDDDHPAITVGRRSGRGLTLKTLLKERVLEPGDGNMTINYLGNKFKGDLLQDGRIRSQETGKIFGTPSAWAIYCKKIVNPDKKSGCGWASVRYRGKKLDAYKNNWYRQKRLEYEKEEEEMGELEEEESGCESEEASPHEQEIIEFDVLGNRNPNHDPSTMIELGTFQAVGRMQPFNITMSSSAMAVIDVHAHLTTSEVVGYLAGQWDVNNHNLIVSHAFPVRCRLGDAEKGANVEQELYAEMSRLKLSLVGWYHTHPFAPPLPSLRDIDSQMDYEMKMKGYNDASYTPVLGIIVSPYQKSPVVDRGIPHPNGNATGFWVMPPAENKPLEYGRPMSMQFTVVQDAFIPKEALLHMSEVIKFYKEAADSVELTDIFEDKITYWHKLKNSLRGRVPKDHFQPLIEFLTKVIDKKLPEDDPIPIPTTPPVVAATSTAPPSLSSLPIPASVAVADSKEILPSLPTSISALESLSNLSSTKDLESCISNILKSTMGTMGADLIAIPYSGSDSKDARESKDKEVSAANSVIITPTSTTPTLTQEKFHEESASREASSSRPKSAEGQTFPTPPPPKSYSPLFQLPLPPLFSLDSGKSTKEGQAIKSSMQPMNFQLDDKRSPASKAEKALEEHPLAALGRVGSPAITGLVGTSKSDSARRRDAMELGQVGSYLDLSKESGDSKTVPPKGDDAQKDVKALPFDLSSWFAQAKLMQEAFALPPHERENPFVRGSSPSSHRDVPPLFPPEFLSPHWSAATLKGGYPLAFPSPDSKPTYHSDVPLLLKKSAAEEPSKDGHKDETRRGTGDKTHPTHQGHRDFRMPPPEYKEPKEGIKRPRDKIEEDKEGKNPQSLRDSLEALCRREKDELPGRRDREDSLSRRERDDIGRREKVAREDPHSRREGDEPLFRKERLEREDALSRREFWGARDPLFEQMGADAFQRDKDYPRAYREMKSLRDTLRDETKDYRDARRDTSLPIPEIRERLEAKRDIKDRRDVTDRRDFRETRDPIEMKEIRDSKPAEIRDARKGLDLTGAKAGGDAPLNLSDATPRDLHLGGGTPMDMSTFKIKRDTLNPDGRHFIEPTGIKKHPPPDPLQVDQPVSLPTAADSSRGVAIDFSDSSTSRSPKDGASVVDGKESKSYQIPLLAKDMNFGSVSAPSRSVIPVEGFEGKTHPRFPLDEGRDGTEAKEVQKPVIKPLINLRDPKSLMDEPLLEKDERNPLPFQLAPQRRLFTPDEDGESMERHPPSTPPVYIPPHRPTTPEERMDYD